MPEEFGYRHPGYAESLSEFGKPRKLSGCGGWILERQIPDSPYLDAMGCYPLFLCNDWKKLNSDIRDLGDDFVSLSLVTDPFGEYDQSYLRECFKDVVVPYKQHFVADLSQPLDRIVSKSHLLTVRRALRKVEVEWCPEPVRFLSEWLELFGNLTQRHHISGLRKFSVSAFRKQLTIPGIVMFRAISGGVTAGLDLWYVDGDIAYGHLVACSELGYKLRASYALKWFLIEYFKKRVKWIDWGGVSDGTNETDGLMQFKKGWATGSKTVYLCGRVLNQEKYNKILESKMVSPTSYFPAYRAGEFS